MYSNDVSEGLPPQCLALWYCLRTSAHVLMTYVWHTHYTRLPL